MANPKHYEAVKSGLWDFWKEENPSVRPNLTGASLKGLDLSDANFAGADLSNATLRDCDLSGAVFFDADLTEADLSGANLRGAWLEDAVAERANFSKSDLTEAHLNRSTLRKADLSEAVLVEAEAVGAKMGESILRNVSGRSSIFSGVDLTRSNLTGADFSLATFLSADLSRSDLTKSCFDGADARRSNLWGAVVERASFRNADLSGAVLVAAQLIETDFEGSNLTDCSVYGVSAWELNLLNTKQSNLLVTPPSSEAAISVDNLEVAQFIYLLLKNSRIRFLIDTITSKVVLILGRFTPERKTILDAIRDELRKRDYLPVLFDFEKPSNRDLTETISTLAHMARFVIADITDAKSIPQELMRIVPALPSVPIQPLLVASQREYGMFEHFKRFPWVLEPFLYEDQDQLLASLGSHVVGPAEKKAREQTGR